MDTRTKQSMPVVSIAAFHTILFLLSLLHTSTHGLSCGSCQSTNCEVLIECEAGVVKDECDCCAVCAQSKGQECGGPFDIHGKCGVNLYCSKPYSDNDNINVINQEKGICRGKVFHECLIVS